MLPVIALVGRPNVGKSTLFNQITRSRDALVANLPGLTRDRKYGEANMMGRRFIVVDTGGLSGDEEGIDSAMASQSLAAIDEADVVLFVVDCRAGLTSVDQQIGEHLRKNGKTAFVVTNKIDGVNHDLAMAPFYEMAIGDLYPTTATHGRGVRALMSDVLETFPEEIEQQDEQSKRLKIAIVGRPNVGKSTLVNRLLGEDRVVVFDAPGTTRDSIYIDYERDEKPFTLIDTAGVRRRKNVSLTVEKFSIVKTLQAIADANVVVLLMDATEGVVDQDLHLIGQVIDAGRGLVLALNKWDGLEAEHKTYVKNELQRRLQFVDYADMHFISALHGTNVGHLYQSIEKAYESASSQLSTNKLTRILQEAVTVHQPPLVNGRRIKLRYAHTGGHNPPIIVIHGNQTDSVPAHYKRYLEKTYRKVLDLHGTPLRIEFKTTDNPFAGRESLKNTSKAANKAAVAKKPSRRSKKNPRQKKKPGPGR